MKYLGREIFEEEIKELLLEEMRYIDIFCQRNQINYFLIGGSLLGAVRHNGYIPWDDDIDIGMLRKDYERFIHLFSQDNGIYQLINADTTKGFYLPFTKISDIRTIVVEDVKNSIPIGISVDLFPFDNCPNDDSFESACNFAKSVSIQRDILAIKNLKPRHGRGIIKNTITVLAQFIFKPISYEFLIKTIHRKISRYIDADSKYVAELSYMPYGNREIYEKEWLENTIRLPFEEYTFSAPLCYDKFLRNTFGNYMQLPSVEQRITHHDYHCWWRNDVNKE